LVELEKASRWNKDNVVKLLKMTPLGRKALKTLTENRRMIRVWKLQRIAYRYKERKNDKEAFTGPWIDENDSGQVVPDGTVTNVLIRADQTAVAAAMTLVHEATHIRQNKRGFPKEELAMEYEAHLEETKFLLELGPILLKQGPDDFQAFIKTGRVDVAAVKAYVRRKYSHLTTGGQVLYKYELFDKPAHYPWKHYPADAKKLDPGFYQEVVFTGAE
jgi:hypothetical protein